MQMLQGLLQPKTPLLIDMHRTVTHMTRSDIQGLASKVILLCFTEGATCDLTFKHYLNEEMPGTFHSYPSSLISGPLLRKQTKMSPLE